MTLSDVEAEREQLGYNTQESADWLIQRVKELEEGIRNLKVERDPEGIAMEELYKLLEE